MTKKSYDHKVTGGETMPKDTFFNLPEEKRQRVEEAAINEFADYNYESASVNRIVESAGIAKGSFYQYFEDKKDLYKHIMDIIVKKKLEYMSPTIANPFEIDVFTLLREMYKSGLSFALSHPKLLDIGNKLLLDPNHEIYKEVIKENKGKSDETFLLILQGAKNRGEIRDDLDLEMASYLLTNLNIAVSDYHMKKTKKHEYTKDMMVTIDKFIDFIQYGMINPKGGDLSD